MIGAQCDEEGADTVFLHEMSTYVEKNGIANSITFVPPIFDKGKLTERICGANVICVPSLSGETFSMAVLEGMAQAKPILVSDFGPMPEAIDHLVNGYVSRAGDVAGMSEQFHSFRPIVRKLGGSGAQPIRRHVITSHPL
jgi:glycosyltransferase involved in cell wall biosynthesis